MGCKERLEDYLRENRISFQIEHHPQAFTAQEVAAREHISGKLLVKVVMVKADGRLVMLALPAPKRVDFVKAAAVLGVQEVRLAGEGEFADAFSDCEVGAMPPFGNLYGIDVYIDRALTEDEHIVFNAGTHTETIRLQYADFARLVNPVTADLAAGPAL